MNMKLLRASLWIWLALMPSVAFAAQGTGCMPTTGTVSGLTMAQDINAGIYPRRWQYDRQSIGAAWDGHLWNLRNDPAKDGLWYGAGAFARVISRLSRGRHARPNRHADRGQQYDYIGWKHCWSWRRHAA
jgi:hypothetical protein